MSLTSEYESAIWGVFENLEKNRMKTLRYRRANHPTCRTVSYSYLRAIGRAGVRKA